MHRWTSITSNLPRPPWNQAPFTNTQDEHVRNHSKTLRGMCENYTHHDTREEQTFTPPHTRLQGERADRFDGLNISNHKLQHIPKTQRSMQHRRTPSSHRSLHVTTLPPTCSTASATYHSCVPNRRTKYLMRGSEDQRASAASLQTRRPCILDALTNLRSTPDELRDWVRTQKCTFIASSLGIV